jgi:hypothetical protein
MSEVIPGSRAILLQSIPRRVKNVVVRVNGQRVAVELRQLTVAERDELRDKAQAYAKRKKLAEAPTGVSAALAIIASAYDPAAQTRMFEDADLEGLQQVGSGGWVDTLFKGVSELMSEEAVEEGKDSAGSPPA